MARIVIGLLVFSLSAFGQTLLPSSTQGGGAGSVTVVSSGSLTSTALVTGGGLQKIQTPSATSTLDASGNISTPGSVTTGAGGTAAGAIEVVQGTAPVLGTNSVRVYADTSVTAYAIKLPAASATGFYLGTDAANFNTMSYVGFDGTGNVVRETSLAATSDWLFKPSSASGTAYDGTPTLIDGTAIPPSLLAAPVQGQMMTFIPDVDNTAGFTLRIDGANARQTRTISGGTFSIASTVLTSRPYTFSFGPSNRWYLLGPGNALAGDSTITVGGNIFAPTFAVAALPAFPITTSGVTSGGLIYPSDTTHIASSALGTANAAWFAGGAGAAPFTDTVGPFVDATNHTLGLNTTRTGAISGTNPVVRIKGTTAGSSGSGLEVQDSAAATLFFVRDDGPVSMGHLNNSTGTLTASILDRTATTGATSLYVGGDNNGHTSATTTQLNVVAGASQSSTNTQQWLSNAGIVLGQVRASGGSIGMSSNFETFAAGWTGGCCNYRAISVAATNITLQAAAVLAFSSLTANASNDGGNFGNADAGLSRKTGVAGRIRFGNGTANDVTGTFETAWGGFGATTQSTGSVLDSNGRVYMAGLTASAGLQTGVMCIGASSEVINDSVACLASAERYKENIKAIDPSAALKFVLASQPVEFNYRPEFNGAYQTNVNYSGKQVGFIADQIQQLDPRLTEVTTRPSTFMGVDYPVGAPQTVRYQNMTAILAGAIQAQQIELDGLKADVKQLKATAKF